MKTPTKAKLFSLILVTSLSACEKPTSEPSAARSADKSADPLARKVSDEPVSACLPAEVATDAGTFPLACEAIAIDPAYFSGAQLFLCNEGVTAAETGAISTALNGQYMSEIGYMVSGGARVQANNGCRYMPSLGRCADGLWIEVMDSTVSMNECAK